MPTPFVHTPAQLPMCSHAQAWVKVHDWLFPDAEPGQLILKALPPWLSGARALVILLLWAAVGGATLPAQVCSLFNCWGHFED